MNRVKFALSRGDRSMPGYFKIAIISSLLLIYAIPSSAEFYQYVDNKGITHFTDKVSTIPAKYQLQVGSHHKTITIPKESHYPEYEKIHPSKIKLKIPKITKLLAQKNMLLKQKKVMNQKFETLMAEKQQIESSKGNMKDEESMARYNKRVKEMNKKIRQYKDEEKRFKLKIGKFNKSISQ